MWLISEHFICFLLRLLVDQRPLTSPRNILPVWCRLSLYSTYRFLLKATMVTTLILPKDIGWFQVFWMSSAYCNSPWQWRESNSICRCLTLPKLFCGVPSLKFFLAILGKETFLTGLDLNIGYPYCNRGFKLVIGWPGLFKTRSNQKATWSVQMSIWGRKKRLGRICLKVSEWTEMFMPCWLQTVW